MSAAVLSPVDATMAVLAASGAVRAVEALVMALDVPREAVQCAAARALIGRTLLNGHLELLVRFDRLPASVREIIHTGSDHFEPALRQMLLHADAVARRQALHIIDETFQFTQIPHLLELLRQPALGEAPRVSEVLGHLLDRLYDAHVSVRAAELGVPAAEALRRIALTHLDAAVTNFDQFAITDSLVLGVLTLGEPHHPAVKRTLWHGPPGCRELAARLLLESRHPGVLRHIALSLLQAYPHPKIFEVLGQRCDPELIAALLRGCTGRLSAQQQQNLRQIEALPWLDVSTEMLATIPPALHPALVNFVAHTRLPPTMKTAVHEWLLRHGTPDGRDAARAHLPSIVEDVVQHVVLESLHDDDVQVQAWAVHQLRLHAVPETFALLIERLDNPNPDVQRAAREELSSFNTERVLELSEQFSPEESHVAGRLVQKVDPEVTLKLRRLLAQPIRQKRIRVARQVVRLGLQGVVPEAFVAMTDDLDPMVRRAAVAALGHLPMRDAHVALRHLQNDPHPRVREEAHAALQLWMSLHATGQEQRS
jgi:hypothetical protein